MYKPRQMFELTEKPEGDFKKWDRTYSRPIYSIKKGSTYNMKGQLRCILSLHFYSVTSDAKVDHDLPLPCKFC